MIFFNSIPDNSTDIPHYIFEAMIFSYMLLLVVVFSYFIQNWAATFL